MSRKYEVQQKTGFFRISNPDGRVLSMHKLRIKEVDGLAFKDLSGDARLLDYEDWRLPAQVRAADLAARLSVEQIAGLMLWSPHQMVPFRPGMPFRGNYNGGALQPDMDPAMLTDEQQGFIRKEKLRNILLVQTESAEISARWNNHLQALAEAEQWGIPVCISSDPRHAAGAKGAEFSGTGREVSRWPEGLGMAATFDPGLMKEFASIVSREYRALGITQALGPQIDLCTDPRWMRLEDTMGADVEMVTEFARAYCDGLQTTEDSPDGWGRESVAAMVKHWPGGGTGEGGRDAHYAFGKFAVYPGGNEENHRRPFTEGAFKLSGPTGKAAAVMPYYTVSLDMDKKYGENVGNSYSKYIIDDLLRKKEGYDGIVCTDWMITDDPSDKIDAFASRCYGTEKLSVAQRHLLLLENGVDMFGGNREKEPIVQAYAMGCEKYGKEAMRRRLEQSAARILTQMFRLGLFEDPYLDPAESACIVGAEDFVRAGLEAQRRSCVLLKNAGGLLPMKKGTRIYVPRRHYDAHKSFFRLPVPPMDMPGLRREDAQGWFELVDDPKDAQAAVVFMESPLSDCYEEGCGNGYLPITLQYMPYRADGARVHSLGQGDFREACGDRSYRGKTNSPYNASDLENFLKTKAAMEGKPVFVILQLHNPCVVREFETEADGILAHFGVENRVLMQILTGDARPEGRLPLDMPANMEAVEQHCEDVFGDYRVHVDALGNRYGYGFGLEYE